MSGYGIHWFRRDLRLSGNSALLQNQRQSQGRMVGVAFLDPRDRARPDFSVHRFAFELKTLKALRTALRNHGSDLLVISLDPIQGWSSLLGRLAQSGAGAPERVSFGRGYEPGERRVEEEVTRQLRSHKGLEVCAQRDHLTIEPDELARGDGGPYRVFTPFGRRWFEWARSREFRHRVEAAAEQPATFSTTWRQLLGPGAEEGSSLDALCDEFLANATVILPEAGEHAALKRIEAFRDRLEGYAEGRDLPAEEATSGLSVYLRNGSTTPARIIRELVLRAGNWKLESGPNRFLKELVWREFYHHLLWHFPRVESEAFVEKYRELPWENRIDLFSAWKEGRTGYPLVDAGMRELHATGTMHNRVRMVVASFLVKDLHIDWRWGARFFMQNLLDGDLAANNGGWQWAASTGADPQPYFRIFNPTLQSLKFDPDGSYLRRWLPERAAFKGRNLHAPVKPVVEHAARKLGALRIFQSVDLGRRAS